MSREIYRPVNPISIGLPLLYWPMSPEKLFCKTTRSIAEENVQQV